MTSELIGKSIIGFSRGEETSKNFQAFNPKNGEKLQPLFFSATLAELETAVKLAQSAGYQYAQVSSREKARFLRQIAENIEALGDILLNRTALETGLALARFQGERTRTCFQLRLFADLVEEGSWIDARIDTADEKRLPLPKPDIRSLLRPLGTVAVFCASNFPLAFSVAGGDTASALAAGCPVIVNAHQAHPGTAELVGTAISNAVRSCGLPEGVFSLLFSDGYEIGQELVKHPQIKAVGFTGSRKGGLALQKIINSRQEPIPFFAEMSSVNPTLILPEIFEEKSAEIAHGLFASFTLGFGQFCTKPGLVFIPETNQTEHFIQTLQSLTIEASPNPLLTSVIKQNFEKEVLEKSEKTQTFQTAHLLQGFEVNPCFFLTDDINFLENPALSEEIFGPSTVLVTVKSKENLLKIINNLEGQLTATIHGTTADLRENFDLVEIFEKKVGRIIFNGFPTGVEVCPAMVHGGVFPATSDSRSTSVGTGAIIRFTRPVCYQNFPDEMLPNELKNQNILSIWRLINGNLSKESC